MRDVQVVTYDESWPEQFRKEAALLGDVLRRHLVYMHHIGSTSVPGLSAKPVIDIMPVVDEIEKVDSSTARLREHGYEELGEFGLPGRRFFRKGGDVRTHHVHVYAVGNPEIDRHLAFRDYLRARPDEAQAYQKLKVRLAERYPHDIEGYMDGKNSWVQKTEAKALAWWSRVPVIFVTGPVGVGKTTLGDRLADILADRHIAHWRADLDRLMEASPTWSGDRFGAGMLAAAVARSWPVARASGARAVVFSHVLESIEEARDLADRIPGSDPWIVRLQASDNVLQARIAGRETDPQARQWHSQRARQLAEQMERTRLGDLLVDTSDRTPEALAGMVMETWSRRFPDCQ